MKIIILNINIFPIFLKCFIFTAKLFIKFEKIHRNKFQIWEYLKYFYLVLTYILDLHNTTQMNSFSCKIFSKEKIHCFVTEVFIAEHFLIPH